MAGLFERMGISDQITPKLKQVPSGVRIGSIIASGEAEIGFQRTLRVQLAPQEVVRFLRRGTARKFTAMTLPFPSVG